MKNEFLQKKKKMYLLLLFLGQLDFPNYNLPFYFIFTINYKESYYKMVSCFKTCYV